MQLALWQQRNQRMRLSVLLNCKGTEIIKRYYKSPKSKDFGLFKDIDIIKILYFRIFLHNTCNDILPLLHRLKQKYAVAPVQWK